MDTNEYPSLPNLRQVHARLAANNRLVEAVIDSQTDGIELLFNASTAQDWAAVAKASKLLAEARAEVVGTEVVREARLVFDELRHSNDIKQQPKRLARLLAACREVKKKQIQ